MKTTKHRFCLLALLSSGLLLGSSCSTITDQIVATIRFALGIVDVWV